MSFLFNEWIQVREVGQGKDSVRLEQIADGFVTPLCLRHDGKRLFIGDQIGKIFIYENEQLSQRPFLDISKLIKALPPSKKGKESGLSADYDERGLLGFAFHPKGQRIYVIHSIRQKEKSEQFNCDNVLVEYQFTADGVNHNTRRELMRIPQEKHTHNGGDLHFGPDGMLYISVGDGGCCGDDFGEIGNGQNLGSLKGKILRIDVNQSGRYKIPSNNPFVGMPGVRPEIWAFGFRNPWRMSFNGKDLWVAAVGEGSNETGEGWESIFIVEKGGNHGWRIREGTHYLPDGKELMKKLGLTPRDLVNPIHEYNHKVGRSIIGGYVYRGQTIPALKGCYVFGDWSQSWKKQSGSLHYLKKTNNKWKRHMFKLPNNSRTLDMYVLALGEGPDNELYVMCKEGIRTDNKKGVVFKLVA